MEIRQATQNDNNAVWDIFKRVIQTGDTYVFDPNTNKEDLAKHWFATNMHTLVLEEKGIIIGTYIIKPNQIDLGSHIANGSYMVHPDFQRKGIGKLLCEHSLFRAKELGFLAMQFNVIVSTNKAAIKLWQKYDFKIIGTVPKGFKHLEFGLVDTLIMYREL